MQQVDEVLQSTDDRTTKSAKGYLQKIMRAAENGASNVFLVDATNSFDAIRASASIFVGSRAASTPAPVNMGRPQRGSHWLVAYLGTAHSSPLKWSVESVTVSDGKIRVTYRESDSMLGIATSDLHKYYYWIPIGKLDSGIYEVELYDAGENAVSLMRRVKVAAER